MKEETLDPNWMWG